jgi:alpha-glucosidase
VHGAEHYKFAGGPTAAFNCIVPFTRNVQGPMDYTPVTYSSHRGNTTLAHQTALAIVFESGVQHFADRHGVYERSVARELLAACPAVWDETLLLEGEPGRFVSIARRRGRAWFVGAITGDEARRLVLPLTFLDDGAYLAEICRDGASDSDQVCEYRRVTARSTLDVALLCRGGCAVQLRPA